MTEISERKSHNVWSVSRTTELCLAPSFEEAVYLAGAEMAIETLQQDSNTLPHAVAYIAPGREHVTVWADQHAGFLDNLSLLEESSVTLGSIARPNLLRRGLEQRFSEFKKQILSVLPAGSETAEAIVREARVTGIASGPEAARNNIQAVFDRLDEVDAKDEVAMENTAKLLATTSAELDQEIQKAETIVNNLQQTVVRHAVAKHSRSHGDWRIYAVMALAAIAVALVGFNDPNPWVTALWATGFFGVPALAWSLFGRRRPTAKALFDQEQAGPAREAAEQRRRLMGPLINHFRLREQHLLAEVERQHATNLRDELQKQPMVQELYKLSLDSLIPHIDDQWDRIQTDVFEDIDPGCVSVGGKSLARVIARNRVAPDHGLATQTLERYARMHGHSLMDAVCAETPEKVLENLKHVIADLVGNLDALTVLTTMACEPGHARQLKDEMLNLLDVATSVFTCQAGVNPDPYLCPEKLTIGLPCPDVEAQQIEPLRKLLETVLPIRTFVPSFNPQALELVWRQVNLPNDLSVLHQIGEECCEYIDPAERDLLWYFPPRISRALQPSRVHETFMESAPADTNGTGKAPQPEFSARRSGSNGQ